LRCAQPSSSTTRASCGDGLLPETKRPFVPEFRALVAALRLGQNKVATPQVATGRLGHRAAARYREAAEKRMNEGYECTDWYFCKKAL